MPGPVVIMGNLRNSSVTLLALTFGLLLLCDLAWWSFSGDEGQGRALEFDPEPGIERVAVPSVVREPVEKEEAARGEPEYTAELDADRPSRPTAETSSSRVSEGYVAEVCNPGHG